MVATILPPGMQQFSDGNGAPYGAGYVEMYIPTTLALKTTWIDRSKTVMNTNPIRLDGNGRCVIFGSGQYRQILKDVFGNTIWDKLVESRDDELEAEIAASVSAAIVNAPAFALTLALAQALFPVLTIVADGQAMIVAGRAAASDGYGGVFVYKLGDVTTVFPSSGRGFVDNAGRRWFRIHEKGRVSVLWYGATGGGVANDYAAVQAAVNDMLGQGQSMVLLPFGTYLNDTQAWDFSGVSVHGFGRIGSILKRGPNFPDPYLWKLDGGTATGGATYKDFLSDGNDAGNATANWAIGLIGNVLYNKFQNLDVLRFKTGALKLLSSGAMRPTLNSFDNCSFREGGAATEAAVDVEAGGSLEFRGQSIENVGGSFFKISGAMEAAGLILVENFYFENSGDGDIDGIVVDAVNPPGNPSGNIIFRNGRVQGYGNAAGTLGNGIDLERAVFTTIDDVAISPRNGASGAGHFKIVASPVAGANVVKNMPNLVQGDISQQSVVIFENCSLGFQRVVFSNASAIPAGSVVYLGAGTMISGATIGSRRIRWGGMDSIAGAYVDMGPLPGAGQQYSIDLVKNGGLPGLHVDLVDANGGTNSVNFAVPLVINDTIELRVTTSAGAAVINPGELRVTVLVYK